MENLDNLIKEALLAKDQNLLKTLRLIKSELTNVEKRKSSPLTEEDKVKVLSKMKEERKENVSTYKTANREDLAEEEMGELKVIESLLPKEPTEREISDETSKTILALLLTKEDGYKLQMRDLGQVMKVVKSKYPTADGKLIKDRFTNIMEKGE